MAGKAAILCLTTQFGLTQALGLVSRTVLRAPGICSASLIRNVAPRTRGAGIAVSPAAPRLRTAATRRKTRPADRLRTDPRAAPRTRELYFALRSSRHGHCAKLL